ncbi:MAG: hypothetical protein ACFFAK_15255 [Promethearchaeota archaeon]
MEKKFVPVLICFIFSIIVFLTFLILGILTVNNPGLDLIPIEYVYWFLPLLPGTMYTDTIFFYLFPILIYLIFFAISPFLVQMLFKINKLTYTFRKKPEYGFLEFNRDIKPTRILYRAIILSFFTFSTTILVMQLLDLPPQAFRRFSWSDLILNPDLKYLYVAEGTFFMAFFLTSFCSLLFLPIWLLEDCGLMLYRTFPEQRRTPIIEGVHNSYFKVLETYTGIATILAYIRQIYVTFRVVGQMPPFDPAILTPLIVLFLPFIITGLLAIPIFIYEKMLSKSLKRVNSRFSKYNLPQFKLPELNDLLERSNE